MNYKQKIAYAVCIVIVMLLFLGLNYQLANAGVWNWLTGGSKTVVIEMPVEKTLDSEIDRLSIKYEISSSTVRAVAECESQKYGGAVNQNRTASGEVWSTDRGYLQINDYYHKANMEALGLDIMNEWDSLEYGFMLMKEQGLTPWRASRSCWISKI